MWKLKRLYATNIVSFKEIDTNFASDVATLVFGNNLDNENQKNQNKHHHSDKYKSYIQASQSNTFKKMT